MSRYTVSVALAAYNGSKYISEQIESIICQLSDIDELVVSINRSTDGTEAIVRQMANAYPQIRIVECEEKGITANFENAIRASKNEIVFLSDQDDVWEKNKIQEVLDVFESSNAVAVVHGCEYVDANLKPLIGYVPRNYRKATIGILDILIRNPVQGSCLAFKSGMIKDALPIPRRVPMHDSWIGAICAFDGEVRHVDAKLIKYRQHGSNNSSLKHGTLSIMISDRLTLLRYLIGRVLRIRIQ